MIRSQRTAGRDGAERHTGGSRERPQRADVRGPSMATILFRPSASVQSPFSDVDSGVTRKVYPLSLAVSQSAGGG